MGEQHCFASAANRGFEKGKLVAMRFFDLLKLGAKIAAAITPIVISAIALYFSYETRVMSRESLSIEVNGTGSYVFDGMGVDAPYFSKYDSPALVGTKWSLDFTNLSSNNISILKLQLHLVEPSSGSKIFFTRMYENFRSVDRNPVQLPLNIEPGKTIRLFVEVRMPLHSKAAEVAKQFKENCEASDIGIFTFYLAEHAGVDIFGNAVETFIDDDAERDLKSCSDQIGGFSVSPDVTWGLDVEARTARSNAFSERGFW